MPPRASSRGDAGRRKHKQKRAASPFGAPFSFGTPLRLNSQPPPRSKRAPSPGEKRRVLDVLDDRDQIGSRPNVGGYGVTAPGAYPDLEQPFVSITDGSEASEAPNPAAAASGPGPAAGGDPLRRVAAGDASAVVAAARAASAEAAAAASADAAYARGKAARLAAAKAAPRVAFGGRPPPKRASPPRRAGAGRRAGVPAAATRRSRRLRVLRAANADSDSDSSSDGSSDGNADGKENVGAKHDTMAFGAGPAFSFGARTSPVPGASLWWGPGAGPDASPGPGAYGDPESRLARHVPAVTFGKPRDGTGEGAGVDRSPTKPPSAKKSRGVWDPLGGVDPDAPGPGHYYDPARSPSRVGASGPKFSFGGGKDDIGKLRAPGPHDTPGPGAYHDSAAAAAAGAAAGSPGSKKFTFGGRVGPDWASSGPGKDAPAPGSYVRDLDVLGRNVRDSANGARAVAPSFTFGGGPLRLEKSAAASRAGATPGPGEYDGDESSGDACDPSATDGRSPSKQGRPKTGFTFGFRRDEENSDARASTPGPGAYDVPGSLRKHGERDDENDPRGRKSRGSGPAFTLAQRLPGGAMDLSRAGDTPGPGEYDAARPGEGILGGGPAFTMGGAASPGASPSPSPSPGPGAYADVRDAVGRDAPAFTMYGRVPDVAGEKKAASVPGPGAYDVVRPVAGAPGSPADGAGATSARKPGPTLKGREAWGATHSGLDSAGKHSPGPAAYVTDAVARPFRDAPAYTMAARPESAGTCVDAHDTPGPGEYHAWDDDASDDDAFVGGSSGKKNKNRSPSRRKGVTFGVRPAHGGALSHLGESASKPGPGQYHDMHFPSAARDRGPAFTIRERRGTAEDDGLSDGPGPGEYYGEYREDDLAVVAGERRGVTIAGRTPAAGFDAATFGSASPGPAYYVGPYTKADLDYGPAISFKPPMASGRDAPGGPLDSVARNADIPGPGYYAPEVFQFPIKDAPEGNVGPGGEFLWAPKGYTFGWRGAYGEEGVPREENVSPGPGEYYPDADDDGVYGFAGTGSTPWRPAPGVTIGVRPRETPVRRSRSSPGPGEYYRPTDGSIGAAGARGPKRGARIEDRRTWETQKRKEKKTDVPAPTDYDVRSSGAKRLTEKRAPAHVIVARRGESARKKKETAEAPAPGEYETARSALRSTGATKFGKVPPSDGRNLPPPYSGPAPGEYEPDYSPDELRKRRASRSAVDIGKSTTRDAPGGVFDGAKSGGDATPGPGEFELDGEAKARVEARAKRRGAVDIARGTTRDAPGGVFDKALSTKSLTPGPGEFWPDEGTDKKKNRRGFAFPSTTHASAGGALDSVLRAGETPGPGEHWPEDGDGLTTVGGARAPGFTMPKSARDDGKRGTTDTPGPGAFHPDGDTSDVRVRGAVNMGKATGRSAAGGVFDTRDGPGPGEHHPELVFDDGRSLSPVAASKRKGVRWSEPPDETKKRGAASPGPGPGEYESARTPSAGAATMPKAPRRSSLVARDAAQRPGPADYEPDDDAPHPMTVAGLLRRRMASGRGESPQNAAEARRLAAARAAARRIRSPPRPGVGEYDTGKSSFRLDKGVKMPGREPWERLASLEASRGSNLPPSKYDPKPEAAARRLKPGRRAPRVDDFADSFRSAGGTLAKGGKGKGVELW